MKRFGVKRFGMLALLLAAALALCGCGRKEPEKLDVQQGTLHIAEPSATAVPVDGGAEAGAGAQTARSIDPEGRMIALTFDDGPGPGTRRILRALDDVGGRATFCMVASRLDWCGETAREVAAQGSEIATHTWDHRDLTKLSEERVRRELRDSLDAIERTAGVRPTVLRPPYGSVNEAVKSACRELGLRIANWNVDPEDWRTRDAEGIREHVLGRAQDGEIVLCHDLYPETASAMEDAIRELDARGFQLVTVSELLDARAEGGIAGEVYYAAGAA